MKIDEKKKKDEGEAKVDKEVICFPLNRCHYSRNDLPSRVKDGFLSFQASWSFRNMCLCSQRSERLALVFENKESFK